MRKFTILILFTVICCGPSEAEIKAKVNEAVEDALETTTTTTVPPTTTSTSTTTTVPPTTTTTTTVPPTTTSTTTTTTVPPTTTTTTTVPPTTTSTTTNIEIKLPNEKNQFPEIPYCKMTYEEVEKQINDFFQNNNIRITIREFIVQTDNVNCYGYVSGSNYSYTDTVESGDFIEITVEGEANNRKFPTIIASTENAKGNNEFFQVYCDLNGLSKTEEYWNGVNLDSKGIRDTILYSQPNDLNIDLNNPLSNCGEETVLANSCYWRVELKNGERVYRNPSFRAMPHYSTGPYATSEGEPFNECPYQQGLKLDEIARGGDFD